MIKATEFWMVKNQRFTRCTSLSSTEWVDRVASEPGLRQVLQAARSWGVPLSVFLGRKVSTVYEHDAAGRVVRSTTEALWTEDDREAALALLAYEAELCPGCHQPLKETTRPEHEDAYRPQPAIRCHRCTASEQGAELYRDAPHASALMVPVVLQPVN